MPMQPSFAAHLAATRSHAVEHIMTRARAANQLAKIVVGPNQKRLLYALKCGCISRALELAPEALIVDSFDRQHGLVGITHRNGIRLHVPARQLTPTAQAVVLQHMARGIPPQAARDAA